MLLALGDSFAIFFAYADCIVLEKKLIAFWKLVSTLVSSLVSIFSSQARVSLISTSVSVNQCTLSTIPIVNLIARPASLILIYQ